jgi:hypothetical protein
LFNPVDADGALLGTLQVDSDLTVEEAGFNRPEVAELLQQFADVLSLLLTGVNVRVTSGKNGTVSPAPKSRVQNATQVEPGLYVANSSTSIFQNLKSRPAVKCSPTAAVQPKGWPCGFGTGATPAGTTQNSIRTSQTTRRCRLNPKGSGS